MVERLTGSGHVWAEVLEIRRLCGTLDKEIFHTFVTLCMNAMHLVLTGN